MQHKVSFKQSTAGMFFFSETICLAKVWETSLPYCLLIVEGVNLLYDKQTILKKSFLINMTWVLVTFWTNLEYVY